jgi:putative endonuclease
MPTHVGTNEKRFMWNVFSLKCDEMGEITEKQKIGKIGEDIAVRFLVKHGFSTVIRNYRKKFGEIDIICRKNTRLHFVEVKTVTRGTFQKKLDDYRPEDNVHPFKLLRIGRTIQAYIFEYDITDDWQFDVITVELDHVAKSARINVIYDVIL